MKERRVQRERGIFAPTALKDSFCSVTSPILFSRKLNAVATRHSRLLTRDYDKRMLKPLKNCKRNSLQRLIEFLGK